MVRISDYPLLRFVGITDHKSYLAWCAQNHPDKKPGDADATRKFQEVQQEYNTYQKAGSSSQPRAAASSQPGAAAAGRTSGQAAGIPKHNMDAFFAAQRKSCCGVPVSGTTAGYCHMKKLSGHNTCFYHIPGTDHLKYLDPDTSPRKFFDVFCGIRTSKPARTFSTCTRRGKSGNWCTSLKMEGEEYCRAHKDAEWKPHTVVEMTVKDGVHLYVGFLNPSALKKARESGFVHVVKQFGPIKPWRKVKGKEATHIYLKHRLIPFSDFDK